MLKSTRNYYKPRPYVIQFSNLVSDQLNYLSTIHNKGFYIVYFVIGYCTSF
jgi:hypothetical protein